MSVGVELAELERDYRLLEQENGSLLKENVSLMRQQLVLDAFRLVVGMIDRSPGGRLHPKTLSANAGESVTPTLKGKQMSIAHVVPAFEMEIYALFQGTRDGVQRLSNYVECRRVYWIEIDTGGLSHAVIDNASGGWAQADGLGGWIDDVANIDPVVFEKNITGTRYLQVMEGEKLTEAELRL